MKSKLNYIIITLVLLLSPSLIFAYPNLIINGDFEDGLNDWTTSGGVWSGFSLVGLGSPNGDNSNYATLLSYEDSYNSSIYQTVDMPDALDFKLSFDFTLVTKEPSWGDDFRAEIWIDYLGGGPFTPIFSIGSGDGGFATVPGYPHARSYTQVGFNHYFQWNNPDEDLVLRFLVLGYSDDGYDSGMLLDNICLQAIPEPATLIMMVLGLSAIGTGIIRRKK